MDLSSMSGVQMYVDDDSLSPPPLPSSYVSFDLTTSRRSRLLILTPLSLSLSLSSYRNDSEEEEEEDDEGSIDFEMDDCEDAGDLSDEGGRDEAMSMDLMATSVKASLAPLETPSASPPIAIDSKLPLQASITGYGNVDSEGGKFVVYIIYVQQRGASWTIYRRYRQFMALHNALGRKGVNIGCQLPPKQMFSLTTSPDFINKRQQGLEKWLSVLCAGFAKLGPASHVASVIVNFFTTDANVKPSNLEIVRGRAIMPAVHSKRRRLKTSVHDFEMIKMIGKGSFGEVMLVRKKGSRKLFAMKILDKKNIIRRNQVEHTITERRVLGRTKHPFIVTLHYAFQTGKKLYFVLDYCSGGELFFHLGRCGRLRESLACFYSAEITLALSHLHNVGIMYRDLKPENILLDKDGHIKLADFGLSKEGIPNGVSGTGSFCGTAEYLAPEILNRSGHGTGVDWWALGMVLYEMLAGVPPWYTKEREVLFERVRRAPLEFPAHMSKPARAIISGFLIRDPANRLGVRGRGVQEVMEQEFYSHIDWKALLERRLAPPFRPRSDIGSVDAINFDKVFTKQRIQQPVFPSSVAQSGKFPNFSFGGHEGSYYRARFRSTGGTVIGTPTTPPLPHPSSGEGVARGVRKDVPKEEGA